MKSEIGEDVIKVAAKAIQKAYGFDAPLMLGARVALEAAIPLLPQFTFTEDDLLQLARGIVPDWLRFDADAALDEELSK